ncbi:penicillin-binding protein 2 [Brachymonas denitrificans]|uniref:Peptidoglycan D,D-transpeptidase MrdA n=1 Tax=Brachymonas denitrificans DSM 15123 TaxID=1121117 RepID=A0A1H8KCV4_9BURK|nr:penicillin-binding protein 2 [Brachymonas denitrificans]SEN90248.1 peptidoglycan glycosyltransferase /cell elongation-specific peptidoglycan D,D-transpeptidase [Brachymonas denitrificans DSM 15123]
MSYSLPAVNELRNAESQQQQFNYRLIAMGLLVLICFGLLVYRWSVLQIVRHADYIAQAESNRTALVPVVPSRGEIRDRNGIVLASNYSAYTLELTPSKIEDLEATINALAELIPISEGDRRRFNRLRADSRSYEAIPLRSRLSDEEIARFATQRYRFPGVEVNARLYRYYPYGELGSHVIGYIGRINQREKEALEESEDAENYKGTDHIGKLGVEQAYETELHGISGREQMETTAGGFIVRRLASSPATPGKNVVLSIDIKLQKMVEDLFGKRRGALVAIDPRNGEVLAFVSKPTFDPNLFVEGIDHENWAALNESLDKPLLNRALRGTYPPGSTYKPFMALAALETGTRTAATTIHDPGYWMFGNHRFRSGHALGSVNLHRSIVKSSNVYYYSLAHEMGVQAIHDFMAPLGFGQLTGIDLKGEVRGILPSPEWKRKAYKRAAQQKWLSGETISLGIGQGYNNFTMLQLSHALATLVNGGTSQQPHVVRGLQEPGSQQLVETVREPDRPLGYKPEHIKLIKSGMVGVTLEGTGKGVFAGAPYVSGGKTGTAQAVTIAQNQRYNAAALSERKRDHSLYVAFAPVETPRIAVAVIVENAGFGATAAAPIARRVLDYWLLQQYPNAGDIAATQVGRSSRPIGAPRNVATMPWPPEDVKMLAPMPDGTGMAALQGASAAAVASGAASAGLGGDAVVAVAPDATATASGVAASSGLPAAGAAVLPAAASATDPAAPAAAGARGAASAPSYTLPPAAQALQRLFPASAPLGGASVPAPPASSPPSGQRRTQPTR